MGDIYSVNAPKGGNKKHVLVLSVSMQAHIAGILRLSIELAKRGVTVTFVCLEKDVALLKTFEEIQGLDFHLVSYGDSVHNSFILTFLRVASDLFRPIADNFVKAKKAGLPGPTCIIGDRFLTWVTDVAKELDVPYYQFWSCGAIFVRTLQAFSQLLDDGVLSVKDETDGRTVLAEFDGVLRIPGLPAFKYGEMPNSALGLNHYRSVGKTTGKADAVIVNTFSNLESPVTDSIRQSWAADYSGEKTRKMFTVGPISTAANFKDRSFVEELSCQRPDCLKWLDSRPSQSVVYVCLGSVVDQVSEQIYELALGLEASEQNFLWVIRPDKEAALPPGFRERTQGKGLIAIGWVPQLQVLAHTSVRCFMTHCGWNSIIESISSGVPMAAWPQLRSDQFVNCRYIVDELKIAVEMRSTISFSGELEQGLRGLPCARAEVERALRILMSEEGQAMRSRVQELKKKAEAATGDGGSSGIAFNDLVESIPT